MRCVLQADINFADNIRKQLGGRSQAAIWWYFNADTSTSYSTRTVISSA